MNWFPLAAPTKGTRLVVHVHPGGKAYVVEFMALDGDTIAIATVLPSQARSVTSRDLTHTRHVETAV